MASRFVWRRDDEECGRLGRQLLPQQPPPPADARHDGADRNAQHLGGFPIGQFFDVGEEHHVAEGLGQPIEGSLDRVRVSPSGVGGSNRSFDSAASSRLAQWLAAGLPPPLPVHVEEDLVKPGPAVGARFEAIEGAPRLQTRLLYQIVGRGTIAAEAHGDPQQLGEVHQRLAIELFAAISHDAVMRAVTTMNVRVRSLYSHVRAVGMKERKRVE